MIADSLLAVLGLVRVPEVHRLVSERNDLRAHLVAYMHREFAVRDLHYVIDDPEDGYEERFCAECGGAYPCPTIRAMSVRGDS